jgi:hypothetical protein
MVDTREGVKGAAVAKSSELWPFFVQTFIDESRSSTPSSDLPEGKEENDWTEDLAAGSRDVRCGRTRG